MALKKICRCGKVISYTEKYCSKCTSKADKERKEQYKHYARNRKDKEEQRFYNSKAWKVTRQVVASRDNYLCMLCLSNKEIESYYTVHHIVELKEDYDKRIDIDNLICLCQSCHEHVHSIYDRNIDSKRNMQEKLYKIIGRGRSKSFL